MQRFDGAPSRLSARCSSALRALVAHHVPDAAAVSAERRLLIGAYFTHEYAVEAAALFNPSIVLAPDQSGLASGAQRFVMSLRAVGEGHLSSIEFRSGVLDADGGITHRRAGTDSGRWPAHAARALRQGALQRQAARARRDQRSVVERAEPTRRQVHARRARSIAERARGAWPAARDLVRDGQDHSRAGIVELRDDVPGRLAARRARDLSRRARTRRAAWKTRASCGSRHDDGSSTYYATYTAYDGFSILPQLIETEDFVRFTISTLNGAAAQNKGMALFPRQIDGKYVMLSRKDRENLHLVDVERRAPLERRDRALPPAAPVGAAADRQLRLADRDRSRLARAHARRRADAPLRDRRAAARPRRSAARDRPSARTAASSPTRASAKATCRTSCTRAVRSCMASGSSCPTGSPTPASRSRTSRSPICSRRCLPADRQTLSSAEQRAHRAQDAKSASAPTSLRRARTLADNTGELL